MVEIPRTEIFVTQAAEGHVLLDGPGVARTLQPDSALHLADLLTDAAVEAAGQEAIAVLGRHPKPEDDQAPNSGPSSSG